MTELELSIKSYFGIIDAEELSSITSLFQLELLKKVIISLTQIKNVIG